MMYKNKKNISISEIYHENTKLTPNVVKTPFFTDKELAGFMLKNRKNRKYGICRKIKLEDKFDRDISLQETLQKRRSERNFLERPISFNDFSFVLCSSYSSNAEIKFPGFENEPSYHLLSAPSAGALYCCSVYVVIRNVKKVPEGIYYFDHDEKQLALIKKGAQWDRLMESVTIRPYVEKSSCALIISADFSKVKHKYAERGYRYALLDAGHIGENVYLTSCAADLGVLGICGFYDDKINNMLSLDGINEAAVYILFLGKKSKEKNYDFSRNKENI